MAFHSTIQEGANHQIHNWTFADESARLAYVPVAGDQGKVALQTDNENFYILTKESPANWSLAHVEYLTGTNNPNGVILGELGQTYRATGSGVWYKCVSDPSGTIWVVI